MYTTFICTLLCSPVLSTSGVDCSSSQMEECSLILALNASRLFGKHNPMGTVIFLPGIEHETYEKHKATEAAFVMVQFSL